MIILMHKYHWDHLRPPNIGNYGYMSCVTCHLSLELYELQGYAGKNGKQKQVAEKEEEKGQEDKVKCCTGALGPIDCLGQLESWCLNLPFQHLLPEALPQCSKHYGLKFPPFLSWWAGL